MEEIVRMLREASEKLQAKGGRLSLPHRIIIGNGVSYQDRLCEASHEDLGNLLHYIADMLEE
jgi:hypothetical protein